MEFEVVKHKKDERNLLIKFLDIFFCSLLFRHKYNESVSLHIETGYIFYSKECPRCGWAWWQW